MKDFDIIPVLTTILTVRELVKHLLIASNTPMRLDDFKKALYVIFSMGLDEKD